MMICEIPVRVISREETCDVGVNVCSGDYPS